MKISWLIFFITLFFIHWVTCNGFYTYMYINRADDSFSYDVIYFAVISLVWPDCADWERRETTEAPRHRKKETRGNLGTLHKRVCVPHRPPHGPQTCKFTNWYPKIRYSHLTNECMQYVFMISNWRAKLKFVFFFIQRCLFLFIFKSVLWNLWNDFKWTVIWCLQNQMKFSAIWMNCVT